MSIPPNLSHLPSFHQISEPPTQLSSPSPYKGKKWRVERNSDGRINPYPPTDVRKALFAEELEGNVIYRFKHVETGQRYIGSCAKSKKGNTIIRRFGNYSSQINNTPKQAIAKAVAQSPEKYSVKIIGHLPNASEPELLQLEEDFQDLYDTRNPTHGFNRSRPTQEPLRIKSNEIEATAIFTQSNFKKA